MGKGQLEHDFEAGIIHKLNLNWHDLRICEMGSIEHKISPRMSAKEYYLSHRHVKEHISIDINGEWGSLPLDLNQPLSVEFSKRFDLVTNYGTGEHVYNQYSLDSVVKLGGGVMIHALTLLGKWHGHCRYHYPLLFAVKLAEASSYDIINIIQQLKNPTDLDTELILVAYRKTRKEFISEKEFIKLPIHVENI